MLGPFLPVNNDIGLGKEEWCGMMGNSGKRCELVWNGLEWWGLLELWRMAGNVRE